MRHLLLWILKNKGADQMHGYRAADQRLCLSYIVQLLIYLNLLAIFCDCTAWFVSDLVGNPENRNFRDAAQCLKACAFKRIHVSVVVINSSG